MAELRARQIDVSGMDPKEVNALAGKQIFRPSKKPSKFKTWLNTKLINYLEKNSENGKRFKAIHILLKRRLVCPSLRFVRWLLRKHIIDSDEKIPKEWYNNHARIFYDSFHQGHGDMWKLMVYRQNEISYAEGTSACKPNDTADEYLAHLKKINHPSYMYRKYIIDIWVTEILEDTADREWLNFSMMRLTHEMMELYGVHPDERNKVPRPGQYPIYLSGGPNNPPYFIANRNMPIWRNKHDKEREEPSKNDETVKTGNEDNKRTES
jgi:hypothetical protein